MNIELEIRAARANHLRAVGGVTSGIISAGQRVKWKTKQFGVTVSHQSEITGFQEPLFFQYSMISGIFKSFQHDHFFQPVGVNNTQMGDLLRFSMPAWLMGTISERLVIRSRLLHLLHLRNNLIKQTAEATIS